MICFNSKDGAIDRRTGLMVMRLKLLRFNSKDGAIDSVGSSAGGIILSRFNSKDGAIDSQIRIMP